VARARQRVDTSIHSLHEAIRIAYRSGESLRDIGRVAKLSRQRVHQIVHQDDGSES
jgi:hypothetical protein